MDTRRDHTHLLVPRDPQYCIRRPVSQVKRRSSRLRRDEFPLRSRPPTGWANTYFVAAIGGANPEVIKHYVENQRNVCDTGSSLRPHG